MQRLFAPSHAGRTINAMLLNGTKFTVHFDDSGFAELPEDEAAHMVACGNGLITFVTPELLEAIKEKEEEQSLTYMQMWKMKMNNKLEEDSVEEVQAKEDGEEPKVSGAEKREKRIKAGKKGKVKSKPKKLKTTL